MWPLLKGGHLYARDFTIVFLAGKRYSSVCYTNMKFLVISLAIFAKFCTGSNETRGSVCGIALCIRKCCPVGKYLANKSQCESTKENFTSALAEIVSENYSVINQPCVGEHETLLLDPMNFSEDAFKISENGFLVVVGNGDVYENYCVDFIETVEVVRALLCFGIENGGEQTHHVVTGKLEAWN